VVVKLLNEYSSLVYKLNESSEKQMKERWLCSWWKSRKRNQEEDFVFTRKEMKDLDEREP